MKGIIFTAAVILLVTGLIACEQIENVTSSQPDPTPRVTIADVHTEFLTAVYGKLSKAKSSADKASGTSFIDACLAAADETASTYGVDPLSREDVRLYIEMGERLAVTKTEFDMREVLKTSRAQEWWDRYSTEATAETAREVYDQHCQLYGAPRAGSALDDVTSVVVSSAEFWVEYRGDDTPVYGPQPSSAGWKERLLRFCVTVAVDGVAGGAAGVGVGAVTGGVGGAVAGGIVGGLASAGADNILFGGN